MGSKLYVLCWSHVGSRLLISLLATAQWRSIGNDIAIGSTEQLTFVWLRLVETAWLTHFMYPFQSKLSMLQQNRVDLLRVTRVACPPIDHCKLSRMSQHFSSRVIKIFARDNAPAHENIIWIKLSWTVKSHLSRPRRNSSTLNWKQPHKRLYFHFYEKLHQKKSLCFIRIELYESHWQARN